METVLPLLLLAASYLLGSVPSGVVVARLLGGPDPRGVGSGNIGATNVLRSAGPKAGVLTLLADLLKGAAPAVAARLLLPGVGALPEGAGMAAILGHNFPVFLGFRGGKGVATTLGALAGCDLPLALLTAGVWVAVAGATRLSSLASLSAAVAAPLAGFLLSRPASRVVFAAAAGALILLRHRPNIQRLLAGTESRIDLRSRKRGEGPPAGGS